MPQLPLEHKGANEQTVKGELNSACLIVPERKTKVTEAKMSLATEEKYTQGGQHTEL